MASSQATRTQAASERVSGAFRRKLAAAVFIAAYFAWFCWDAVLVRLDRDDLMNMVYCWRLEGLKLVRAQFELWGDWYRPFAGVVYIPILRWFGLDSAPLHIAILLFLLAGVFLLYRFARLLGCSPVASGLAALVACYHAGLADLYYNGAFIYDVLCWFFYLAVFVYYLRIRAAGRLPNAFQTVVLVALYVCALNSKEMAVTLPVMLLVYELIFDRPRWNRSEVLRWIGGPARTAWIGAALNLLYIYGRALRPNALMAQPGYGPQFSWERVATYNTRFIKDVLEAWNYFGGREAAIAFALLFCLMWIPKRPVLKFCFAAIAITPLPIEFLEGRGGACSVIPASALIIFASVLFADVAHLAAVALPPGKAPGNAVRKAVFAAVCLAGVFFWAGHNAGLKRSYIKGAMAQLGKSDWPVIEQMRALNPKVAPNSTVVFLNDPFEGWDMDFIAELWFRDHTISVRVPRKAPMTPEELAAATHVFDFQDGKLVQVR